MSTTTLKHFLNHKFDITDITSCSASVRPARTPDRFHRRATIYSISTTHVLESDATSGNQKKKKKKHAELDDSLAGDDVFCGYIRGAVCGQRYLSRTDFSDCQLPVIKLKMHSCQTRQKMWPCEAARSEETPFGPSSRKHLRQTHANHTQAAVQTA